MDGLFHVVFGAMEMASGNFLGKDWEHFEAWIREKGGGEISWKLRPRNTKMNRMVVAMSILKSLEQNGGKFPPAGIAFIKIVRVRQDS
jgi:hypothetical protein